MCNPIFATAEEAVAQSIQWMRIAMEVIDISRYKHLESIQDIQAMIIMRSVEGCGDVLWLLIGRCRKYLGHRGAPIQFICTT
ncbi:Fungal transcriptional regulatory protein, N-terminal [Penicillium digitatum]|uniref:Fungal transcriptional regulatory protein, N-terminal n=1 Tax=Penicillium digitatum TaxID=36651 RepID=A0A7T6XHK8_PENDI|nr:Fungal transcriptional regulatory protein, N-terminal [Penicillium digitatum]